MSHDLWFTAWSFVFGICAQQLNLAVPATLSRVVAVMAPAVAARTEPPTRFQDGESALILLVSVATVLWLKEAKLPARFVYPLSLLSRCLFCRSTFSISTLFPPHYSIHTGLFHHIVRICDGRFAALWRISPVDYVR